MFAQKLTLAAVMGLGLIGAGSAFAADTADITVTGTITPAACDITLTNADISHGKIAYKHLTDGAVKELNAVTVGVNVLCDAATKFALSADNGGDDSSFDPTKSEFGLGKNGATEKFGYFTLRFDGSTLMGEGADRLIGLNSADKATWTAAPTSADGGVTGPVLSHSGYLGFGAPATTDVKDITEFDGDLEVRTFIAPKDELTLTADVDFNGNATVVVNYL